MTPPSVPPIRTAEVLLPCRDLPATQAFFTEELGFRIESVRPADDPAVVTLSGHGLRVRLERGADGPPLTLRLACENLDAEGPRELTAPNGVRVELVEAAPALALPALQPSFALTRLGDDLCWTEGRAGMSYRDLIPDRQGGRFIASHIRIARGGPVGDWVHFHRVAFQMIYCRRGWVRVVYEDQGEPFELSAGDCVLQPPRIRHRVLACSDGLEVIEIGCPAEHETLADHELSLPTSALRPDRDWDGQRFHRHRCADARWESGREEGFEVRDLGLARATSGLAEALVLRPAGPGAPPERVGRGDLDFHFVLAGGLTLSREGHAPLALGPGDCWTLPAGRTQRLESCSDSLELLQVRLPA